MANTNYCSIFALSKTKNNMKQKTFKIAVSGKEYELLEAIRNYNKSFPDG